MTVVVGTDGASVDRIPGWVAVRLDGGRLDSYAFHGTFADLLEANSDAAIVGVDVPIGHDDPEGSHRKGRRACDVAAKAALGSRHATVFHVPPPQVLDAATYEDARRLCEPQGWTKPSAQLWAIRNRILEVKALATDRVREVHPELSFGAINDEYGDGGPLEANKRSQAGLRARLALLHEARLRPRRILGGLGRASPDDVLDATAVAWTAHRIVTGIARTIPDDPPMDPATGRPVAIWY